MKLRIRTQEDFGAASPTHRAATADSVEHFKLQGRNVADHFKDVTTEDVKKILADTAFPYAVCFEHWTGDFNISTGIRNANAFNARKVFYVGDKRWDRRGAVGVHNYTDVEFLQSIDDLRALKKDYIFVGIDNVPGSVMMEEYTWQANTLLIFGEEGVGLTPGMQAMCEAIVAIPMFGSVRSLNCGTASGIVMHDFVSKIGK